MAAHRHHAQFDQRNGEVYIVQRHDTFRLCRNGNATAEIVGKGSAGFVGLGHGCAEEKRGGREEGKKGFAHEGPIGDAGETREEQAAWVRRRRKERGRSAVPAVKRRFGRWCRTLRPELRLSDLHP
ncbi:hypothetical protein D3C78_1436210 [compost metagenome]